MAKDKPGSSQTVKAASAYRKKMRDFRLAKRAQLNFTQEELLEQAKNHPNTKAMLAAKAKRAAEQQAALDAAKIELTETFS